MGSLVKTSISQVPLGHSVHTMPESALCDFLEGISATSVESIEQLTSSGSVIVFISKTTLQGVLGSESRVTRSPRKTDPDFIFGNVTVNFSAMEVSRDGVPVVLTGLEFNVLKYMIHNARRVISRDELLNEVWGYENYPCTRTVDNHIMRLRHKLEQIPSRPAHFRTVHGTGYKFTP